MHVRLIATSGKDVIVGSLENLSATWYGYMNVFVTVYVNPWPVTFQASIGVISYIYHVLSLKSLWVYQPCKMT